MRPVRRSATTTQPLIKLGSWGEWIARWFGAMLAASLLGVTLFLALEGDGRGGRLDGRLHAADRHRRALQSGT